MSTVFIGCNPSIEQEHSIKVETMQSPAGHNASLPYLVTGEDQNLYISWVERDSNLTELKYAKLTDKGWSSPELIANGNDWFVNWADYPMIAIDKEGNKMAHYLAKSSAGTYSYDVNIVLKAKDSTNWSDPIIPHNDGTPTEHGFVTMLANNDASFTLAWLDGRNTAGDDHSNHSGGAMTIRSAVMDIQGNVSQEVELDGRVCDCCQTTGVLTKNGPTFIYRDRSVDEVRDMAFVSKLNGEWTVPKLVAMDNWNIAGCPVNGPRADATPSTIAVAWYSGALSRPKIKVAFKTTSDFEAPIMIDDTSPVGRVDLIMTSDTTAFVSWMDGGDKPAIKYRKVNKNGSMSPTYVVNEILGDRGSGFPQMAIHDNTLYFAWTELGDVDQIQMKKVALN